MQILIEWEGVCKKNDTSCSACTLCSRVSSLIFLNWEKAFVQARDLTYWFVHCLLSVSFSVFMIFSLFLHCLSVTPWIYQHWLGIFYSSRNLQFRQILENKKTRITFHNLMQHVFTVGLVGFCVCCLRWTFSVFFVLFTLWLNKFTVSAPVNLTDSMQTLQISWLLLLSISFASVTFCLDYFTCSWHISAVLLFIYLMTCLYAAEISLLGSFLCLGSCVSTVASARLQE